MWGEVVRMDKKIICYIQAFDCEKTIEAAMQSVLDQTYENWLCFVLSNGNQPPNNSLDVIKAVAARDRRFVVLNKQYNEVGRYIPMLCHLAKLFPDSYICSLDADDEYKSDFFERAITLAEEHQLDIVACGTEIVLKKRAGSRKETLLSKRELKEDRVINEEDFTSQFPLYKPFFNEMWGKLYRASLLSGKFDEKELHEKFYFRFLPDTLFTIDNLSRSTNIGILSGMSHKFCQFQQRKASNATVLANESAANHQEKGILKKLKSRGRFSVYRTYETIMGFLNAHGTIDENIYEYMQAVLFGWFWDFYTRTLLLTTDEVKLAEHAYHLVFHEKFDELMTYRDSGKYQNLEHYESRMEFCQLLRNTIICQEFIQNRPNCISSTRRKLDKIANKLDYMSEKLSELQLEGKFEGGNDGTGIIS